jgi:hypothetical protein
MSAFMEWVNVVHRNHGGAWLWSVRLGMCRILRLISADMTPLGRAGLEVAGFHWGRRQVPGRGLQWYAKNIVDEYEAQGKGFEYPLGVMMSTKGGARQTSVLYVLADHQQDSEEARLYTEYFEEELDVIDISDSDVSAALGDPIA